MDFREKLCKPNPREQASAISKLLFLWIIPLFKEGLKKDLSVDDMYDVPKEDKSQKLGMDLAEEWGKEKKAAVESGKTPKFLNALVKVFGPLYVIVGVAILFDECVIRVAQPVFLRLLIRSFGDHSVPHSERIVYALGVCLTSFLHAVIIHPLSFEMLHIGMKCRVASCSLIYKKVLLLSKKSQEDTTIGQLINLISNDVNRFDMNLMFIPYLIIGPIQTLIFLYFLWEELGVSCLAGVGFVFLLMPVQYYMGVISRNLRFKLVERCDERCRLMNEIIIAMRVIKMYAWEKPFTSLISQVRREEVHVLRHRAYLKSFYLSLFLSSKKLVPYLTFLAYVFFGHALSADKVFFAVTIFDIIITNMVSTLPSAAAGAGELSVAITRIEEFLLLKEKNPSTCMQILQRSEAQSLVPSIKMQNMFASWEGDKMNLDNFTVDLKGGLLVMVVGPCGCGKTSFLQAVLEELPLLSGKCKIEGSITYCIQDPWIFSATVRQNIIFGRAYLEELYEEIIAVCALTEDFRQLPQGDCTLVGERGITLSGGQKARINLARTLYKESEIYLFDDPLSAVDSRVSRHIFDKCIKKYLAGRLRIVVTHQLQYLHEADYVVVMNKGSILAQGTYQTLLEAGIDFVSLITSEVEVDLYRQASLTKLEAIEQELKKEAEDTRECQEEKKAVGSVSLKTYWEYFRSGESIPAMTIVFFGFFVSQMLYTFSDFWLSYWTNNEEEDTVRKLSSLFQVSNNATVRTLLEADPSIVFTAEDKSTYFEKHFYIIVYSGLVLLIALATNVNSAYFFRYCMKISINVHNKMFASVVRAPMKFFDENPSGRIMNRFAKDLSSMDEHLPSSTFDVITILLTMVGVIGVVVTSNYYVTIPTSFLVIALWLIRKFYIQTARDVKRIESIVRSPIFTHTTASLQGLTTIRALKSEEVLISQFESHQDIHSAAWFLFISSNRWFGISLELVTMLFLSIVTFSFMIISSTSKSGYVGLAISSVLSVTFKFQWGMRQTAEMEHLMTSVERCVEYIKLGPECNNPANQKYNPPPCWPQEGGIIFQNVSLTYEEKDVLKDLSFEIHPREKVGIVGRTGAGKTSIITALFRMGQVNGDVFIDNVNTSELELQVLRRHISIIPQDPVLFSGTLRYNLDPFGESSDHELWHVVEQVGLNKEVIPWLDMKVQDGGINFSFGQRQMVCLARALLRKNRIIVLDEATANVDPRTDQLIQQTIRQNFEDCTIITIAHRLHSVMDCDKILVLEGGVLKEFDHPHKLLHDEQSYLYKMAQATGRSGLAFLKSQALNAYNRSIPKQI